MSMTWNIDGKKDDNRLNLFSLKKQATKRPNREGLRMLRDIEGVSVSSYPKKCRTDEQKYFYLARMFLDKRIEQPMFIEFAEVLKFQTNLVKEDEIQKTLESKASNEMNWDRVTPVLEEKQ